MFPLFRDLNVSHEHLPSPSVLAEGHIDYSFIPPEFSRAACWESASLGFLLLQSKEAFWIPSDWEVLRHQFFVIMSYRISDKSLRVAGMRLLEGFGKGKKGHFEGREGISPLGRGTGHSCLPVLLVVPEKFPESYLCPPLDF